MNQVQNKIKILFFVPLPPPVHGAALRSQSLTESRLIKDTYNIILVPFNFAKTMNDIGKPSVIKLGKFISRTAEVIYKMVTQRPQLTYFNFAVYGFAFYRDFFFAHLFKIFDTRLILHLRTQGVKRQIARSRLKRWMFRNVFKGTEIICLSRFLSKDIEDVYYGTPWIVNNGVEDVFPQYGRADRNAVAVVLFLSNLSKTKGVLDLVEAFSILKLRGVDFKGIIAGPSADLSLDHLLREITNKHLQDYVEVIGPKYGEEKFKLLSQADIFVLPTYFEAFPGVVLEAMQFCIPVVGTNEGAIPEIIDDDKTGFVVRKQDPEELAEKILILINDQGKRRELGQRAREKFENKYTLQLFEERMKEVFDSISANGTGGFISGNKRSSI